MRVEKLTHKIFFYSVKKERRKKFSSIQVTMRMDRRKEIEKKKTYFSCVTSLSILDESRVAVEKRED
jgi:predicted NUDIX family phosphoesterase